MVTVQKSRCLSLLMKESIVIVVICITLFPTYAFLRYSFIPVSAQTCIATEPGVFINASLEVTAANFVCNTMSDTLTVKVNFPIYAITIMTVIGWCMLVWFLPVGMWAYPFDNIGAWVTRPKPMKPDEFSKAKTHLALTMEALMKKGKELVDLKTQSLEEEGGKGKPLRRFLAKRKLVAEQHKFENNCSIAEAEFNKLDSIAAYASKVEPCRFFFYLVLGIVMAIWSLMFIVHIFCYLVALKPSGVASNPFYNQMLSLIETSAVQFAAIPIFILCGYYFLFCAHKGNIKLGMRFLFVTFYPIAKKETFVNSFFANCIVINLYSVAVTQFTVQCFAEYLRGTTAAKIWLVQVQHMQVWTWLFVNNFFVYFTVAMWFLVFIYFCVKPFEKIYLGGELQKMVTKSKKKMGSGGGKSK